MTGFHSGAAGRYLGGRIVCLAASAHALTLAFSGCGESTVQTADSVPAERAILDSDPWDFSNAPAPGTMQAFPPVPIMSVTAKLDGANLLECAGFEGDAQFYARYWKSDAKAENVHQVNHPAADDGFALRVDTPGPFQISQEVILNGGGMYLLRAHVLPRNAGRIWLEVVAQDSESKELRFASDGISGSRDIWAQEELAFELPETVKNAEVLLRHEGVAKPVSGETTILFDACEFYHVSDYSEENLLTNGEFSEGASGLEMWDLSGAAVGEPSRIAQENFGADQYNVRSLRMDPLSTDKQIAVSKDVPDLSPGKSYILQGYIKTQDLLYAASLDIRHGDTNWKGYIKESSLIDGTAEWKQVHVEFTVPEDTNHMVATLKVRATAESDNDPGTAWFDRIEVFKKP